MERIKSVFFVNEIKIFKKIQKITEKGLTNHK